MKFTDLVFNPLMRMNEVCRYSSVYQDTDEKLSDHIVDVMMMSYLIATNLVTNCNESIDMKLLLEKCLFHDIDEVITGDVPRNTKYATYSCKKELNTVAESAVDLISELSSASVKSLWKSAKSGNEGQILEVADMLSVAKKCIIEIELRSNLTFLKVITELETHLSNMIADLRADCSGLNLESSLVLIDILQEAQDEVKYIRIKYDSYINKYHIKENVLQYTDESASKCEESEGTNDDESIK